MQKHHINTNTLHSYNKHKKAVGGKKFTSITKRCIYTLSYGRINSRIDDRDTIVADGNL